MNNKGFTTVEVIISFALVVIVMVSMTSMLVSYRDTISNEEIKTRMVEFKNSVTYMIYEDIVFHGVNGLRYCDDNGTTTTGTISGQIVDEDGNKQTTTTESGTTVSNGKCVDFMKDGKRIEGFRLELVENVGSKDPKTGAQVYKTFLNYRGIMVMLPDSDLNKIVFKEGEVDTTGHQVIDKSKQVSVIYDFLIPPDDSQYGITSLTIPFEHHGIDYKDDIKIVIAK